MCDDNTVNDANEFLASKARLNDDEHSRGLSRRTFGSALASATVMASLPPIANALATTESDVLIDTPDGQADAYLVHPSEGRYPGVIIWPDVLSLRPAFRQMGKRLAQSGYTVLVANPYYRSAKAPVVPQGASFQDESTRNIVLPMARALTHATTQTDARAFVSYLDQHPAIDTARKIATTGYCMGGSMTVRTAAAIPERIGAAASFHGGRLVTDTPDSPHLLIPTTQAQYLIAIATNDDEREPETKDVLRKSFAAANRPAEIEVYEGALHGWCPPDSRVYNEPQAERAWSRLLALLERSL